MSGVCEAPMQPEHPPCPLCGGADGRSVVRISDPLGLHAEPFGLRRCGGCGLFFTSPRPRPEQLGRYYEGVYSGPGGEAMFAAQTHEGLRYVNEARWRYVARHLTLTPEDRVLDVGCGYGAFLAFVHGRSGARLFGVDTDPGSIAGNLCREHGDLRLGTVAEARFEEGSFALISLLHSLEHMPDPVACLRELRPLLRPGGLLLVEVPNFRSLLRPLLGRAWFPLLVPQHLAHFEPGTLGMALERAGFVDRVELRAAWCPFELSSSLAQAVSGRLCLERRPPWLRRLAELFFLIVFVVVDLPLSLALVLLGRSGSLLALARGGVAARSTS